MNIHRFSNTDQFIAASVGAIAAAALEVLATKSRLVLALPGGSTARNIVPQLCNSPLPWNRVTLTLTDERWVPPNHPDSNEGLIRSLMAGRASAIEFAGYYSEGLAATAAPDDLSRRIPLPDIAVLGVGADGHIASIFPNDPANQSSDRYAVVPRPDHMRLTLTAAALRQIPHLLVVTNGHEKAAVLDLALHGGPAGDLPVRHAIRAGAGVFLGP